MGVWRPSKRVNGKRVRFGNWMLRIKGLRGETVTFSSGTQDKAVAATMERMVEKLRDHRRAGLPPDEECDRWLSVQLPEVITKIVEMGIVDPRRLAAIAPMSDHLDRWSEYLKGKRQSTDSRNHIWRVNRVEALLKELKITNLADLTNDKVQGYVRLLMDRGMATKTAGDYGVDCKAFCAWLVKNRYLAYNPLDLVHRPTYVAKRPRRAETPDVIQRLIVAAFEGKTLDVFGRELATLPKYAGRNKGITGPERGLIYWFIAETGARESQVRALNVEDLVLDGTTPYVKLHKHNKKGGHASAIKRLGGVPLVNSDLIAHLRVHVAGRNQNTSVFQCPRSFYKLMRVDMERAGIPEVDEHGRVFDVHGLRHSYVSTAVAAGLDLHVVSKVVGHVNKKVTEDVYLHTKLQQAADAMLAQHKYTAPVRLKLSEGGAA